MSDAIKTDNGIITIDLSKFKGQTVREVEHQFKELMTSIKLRYEIHNHRNPEAKRYLDAMLEQTYNLKHGSNADFKVEEVIIDRNIINF